MNNDQGNDEKFTVNVNGAEFLVEWVEASLHEKASQYLVKGNNLEFTIELNISNDLSTEWVVAKGDNIPADLAEAVGQQIENHDM